MVETAGRTVDGYAGPAAGQDEAQQQGPVAPGMAARLQRSPEERRARAWLMVSKVAVSVVGGLLFVWGSFLLSLALTVRAGYDYGEMQSMLGMLSIVVYPAAFVWSYVSRNQRLVWLVLAGGGALMLLLGWWLQPV